MATTTTTTTEEKDPYSGLRQILYSQRPETRDAEVRAQRNRAKATAFLQAFGNIADAFTLSKGGDVPKRDLNPYIMNNLQRADAIGEHDRADRRAWENSLFNLENNIVQYNNRQQELIRQNAFRKEELEQQHEYQKDLATHNSKLTGELQSDRIKKEYEVSKSLNEQKFGYDFALANEKNGNAMSLETQKQRNRIAIEAMRQKGREEIARIRSANKNSASSGNKNTSYMEITDPDDNSKMLGLNKNQAELLFGAALLDVNMNKNKDIGRIIVYKETYTDNDIRLALQQIAKAYPQKIIEYLGALKGNVSRTISASMPSTSATPTLTPKSSEELTKNANSAMQGTNNSNNNWDYE